MADVVNMSARPDVKSGDGAVVKTDMKLPMKTDAKPNTKAGLMATVVVLFDYEYKKKDGTPIIMKKDQVFELIGKTNDIWWRVRPTAMNCGLGLPEKGFYVPANYVQEMNEVAPDPTNDAIDINEIASVITELTPDQTTDVGLTEEVVTATEELTPGGGTVGLQTKTVNQKLETITEQKLKENSCISKDKTDRLNNNGSSQETEFQSFADKKKSFESMLAATSGPQAPKKPPSSLWKKPVAPSLSAPLHHDVHPSPPLTTSLKGKDVTAHVSRQGEALVPSSAGAHGKQVEVSALPQASMPNFRSSSRDSGIDSPEIKAYEVKVDGTRHVLNESGKTRSEQISADASGSRLTSFRNPLFQNDPKLHGSNRVKTHSECDDVFEAEVILTPNGDHSHLDAKQTSATSLTGCGANQTYDRDEPMIKSMPNPNLNPKPTENPVSKKISRQRPASINYLGNGSVNVGALKHQLRKANSREELNEKGSKTTETVKPQDLQSDWKTQSCENLLAAKTDGSISLSVAEEPKAAHKRHERHLPPGWMKVKNGKSDRDIYTFRDTDVKWFSEHAEGGRLYYYSEDGNKSTWELPTNPLEEDEKSRSASSLEPDLESRDSISSAETILEEAPESNSQQEQKPHRLSSSGDFQHQTMDVVRKGWLNYAKLQQGAKKMNKTWSKEFVMLIGNWLTFYANEKKAKIQLPNYPFGKPEFKVDMHGGKVEDAKDKTKKPNALLVTASISRVVIIMLLQWDDTAAMEDWKSDLLNTIAICEEELETVGELQPSPQILSPDLSPTGFKPFPGSNGREDFSSSEESLSKRSKIFRRSKKQKNSTSGSAAGSAWLEKWFQKRPSLEEIKEKGLVKSATVFGANIESLVERETATSGGSSHMPIFAARCMGALEARQLMAVDGIYRINGNSAEIQRLRFMVEAGLEAYNLMDLRWDTHVLTGALKLFFRELEQPLVPWEVFETTNDILRRPAESDLQKSKILKEVMKTRMPPASKATLEALCRHLLRVVDLKAENRMQASNLAIVFGPTLMWSEAEASGGGGAFIAINMMYQSQIVEFFLTNFSDIF